jgi:ribosomal protein S18 acetylase RimI-like enzyme
MVEKPQCLASDVDEVLAIEREMFGPRAWVRPDFAESVPDDPACVAAWRLPLWPVAGYVVYRREWDHVVIEHLAVRPICQRRGGGRALLDFLKRHVCPPAIGRIECRVPESCLAGQLFLSAEGFVATGMAGNTNSHWPDQDAIAFVWRAEWLADESERRFKRAVREGR